MFYRRVFKPVGRAWGIATVRFQVLRHTAGSWWPEAGRAWRPSAPGSGTRTSTSTDYEWFDTDREHARRRIVKIYAQAAQLLADTGPHQSRVFCNIACDLDPLGRARPPRQARRRPHWRR